MKDLNGYATTSVWKYLFFLNTTIKRKYDNTISVGAFIPHNTNVETEISNIRGLNFNIIVVYQYPQS